QALGAKLGDASLRAADVESPDAALVMGRDRYRFEHALDLVVGEPLSDELFAGAVRDELLRAGAGRHSLRLNADEAAKAALGGGGRADQRVQLLGFHPAHRRGLVLGVAGTDRDLGAETALALAHALGDV